MLRTGEKGHKIRCKGWDLEKGVGIGTEKMGWYMKEVQYNVNKEQQVLRNYRWELELKAMETELRQLGRFPFS